MLAPIAVAHKHLADYASLVGRPLVNEIHELAEDLQGKRILHLSATAFGGGVSELLYTIVPLMIDAGLDCEWQVIHGTEEFFNATKVMHNSLQGSRRTVTSEQWTTWLDSNETNARELSGEWDVVVVHDPQPAAICSMAREHAAHWIWRCHIDLSEPDPETIGHLLPYVNHHPDAVFHLPSYVPPGISSRPHIVPPAIDPLTPKNMTFAPEDAMFICAQFAIDVDRPLLCQVSRFDPWKDPIGVIDAYRIVKRERPEVQLALVRATGAADPRRSSARPAAGARGEGSRPEAVPIAAAVARLAGAIS